MKFLTYALLLLSSCSFADSYVKEFTRERVEDMKRAMSDLLQTIRELVVVLTYR